MQERKIVITVFSDMSDDLFDEYFSEVDKACEEITADYAAVAPNDLYMFHIKVEK